MIRKFVGFSERTSILQKYIAFHAEKNYSSRNIEVYSNPKPSSPNYQIYEKKEPDAKSHNFIYKLPERIFIYGPLNNNLLINEYNKIIKPNVVDNPFNKIFDCLRRTNCEQKIAPTFRKSEIIEDPYRRSQIIKVTLPHLITIRRHKMKKHKRKKWIRKILFVLRKRRLLKEKRREKEILDFIQAQEQRAKAFDAEKLIEQQLIEARSTGWGIDILSERYTKLKLEKAKKS